MLQLLAGDKVMKHFFILRRKFQTQKLGCMPTFNLTYRLDAISFKFFKNNQNEHLPMSMSCEGNVNKEIVNDVM